MTTDDPARFPHPTRTEHRGAFPAHGEGPPPGFRLRTGPEARLLARARLAIWRANHPGVTGDAD